MLRVFSCLNAHDSVRDHVDKRLTHRSEEKKDCNRQGTCFMKEENWNERDKLQDAHDDDVRLPACASYGNVVRKEAIDKFDRPRDVD